MVGYVASTLNTSPMDRRKTDNSIQCKASKQSRSCTGTFLGTLLAYIIVEWCPMTIGASPTWNPKNHQTGNSFWAFCENLQGRCCY